MGQPAPHQAVQQCIGMRVGTNPHALTTVGPHGAPVIETGFGIESPPFGTGNDCATALGNGTGRTDIGAFFTDGTEMKDRRIETDCVSFKG